MENVYIYCTSFAAEKVLVPPLREGHINRIGDDQMPDIQANMSGTVSEVLVKENDAVEEGQEVIILESMKMHIPIKSPVAGTVSAVLVAKGDFVKTDQNLITLA